MKNKSFLNKRFDLQMHFEINKNKYFYTNTKASFIIKPTWI
jgi:hypothetical protein